MPAVGDTVSQFGREWIYMNPDPSKGPGTWRLSSNDDIASGDAQLFFGELPIEVQDLPFIGAPSEVTVSMDISKLPESGDIS